MHCSRAVVKLRAQLKIIETPAAVSSVAFSPDGQRIVSGGVDDGTVRLWDAATGQPIGQPMTGHTDRVYSVAFSPDGQRIVSGSADNTVRLWDADTGQTRRPSTDRAHRTTVYSVAFSPDGQRIVSGSDDNTVRLWDAATGQPDRPAADRAHRRCGQRGVQPRRQRGSSPAVGTRPCGCGTRPPANPIGQPLTGHTGRGEQRGVQPRRQADRHRQCRQHRAAVGRGHRPTHRPAADRPHRAR